MSRPGGYVNNDESLGWVNAYNRKPFQRCRIINHTTKPHDCGGCESTIPTGSTCYYLSGSDGFKFYYYHSHLECGG